MSQDTAKSVERLLEEARNAAFPTAAYLAKKTGCSPDDILNDAALKVCEDPSKLAGEYPIATFRRVVRNVGMDYLRRGATRRKHEISMDLSDDLVPDRNLSYTGSGSLEQQEITAEVRSAISRRLNSAQSEVASKMLEGQSLSQIAETRGESLRNVSKERVRAEEKLRESSALRRLFESLSTMLLWIKREPVKATSLCCAAGVLVVAGIATASGTESESEGADTEASTVESLGGEGSGGTTLRADEVRGARVAVISSAGRLGGEEGRDALAADVIGVNVAQMDGSPQTLPPRMVGAPDGVVRSGSVDAQPEGVLTHHRIDRGTSGTPYLTWTELDGLRHGVSTVFRADGTRQTTTTFARGLRHGPHIEFAEDGIRINRIVTFENGKWVHSSEDDE